MDKIGGEKIKKKTTTYLRHHTVVGFNGRGVLVVAPAEIRHVAGHHPWLVERISTAAAAAGGTAVVQPCMEWCAHTEKRGGKYTSEK